MATQLQRQVQGLKLRKDNVILVLWVNNTVKDCA